MTNSGSLAAQFSNTIALNLGQLNQVTASLLGMGVSINRTQLNVSYGSVLQNGKILGAGKTLYYVVLNGNSGVTEYTVNVNKKVPDLHIKIGNFVSNSSMGNVTLLDSVYNKVGNKIYPVSTYSINPQLNSSLEGNNTLNYTYSVYVGGSLKASGSASGNGVTRGFVFGDIPINQPTKITFDAQGNSNYTNIDPTVYVFYSSADSNVIPPTGTVLASDLICGSLTVSSGNTLTTDGFSILCNSTVTNSGTIATGNPGNGGSGISGAGGSYASAYGGSGGGGGGGGSKGSSGSSGATPTAPTVTNTNIQTWYSGTFSNYDSAGGGGADGSGDSGGSGSYGVYIQANSITAGTINAVGAAGTTSSSTNHAVGGAGGSTSGTPGGAGGTDGGKPTPTTSGGGGGGGGWVLLAYGTASVPSTSSVTVTGGAGATAPAGNNGGSGGSGTVSVYSYGTTAPIVVVEQLQISPTTIPNAIIDVGQSYTFSTTASNGAKPYTGNWLWTAPASSGLTTGNTVIAGLTGSGANVLSLTLSPQVSNDLSYTFNGVNYDINTIDPNTIVGAWAFNGIVADAGGETVSTSGTPTISVNSLPVVTLSPSSTSLSPGQTETFTITVNGGTGPFDALLYNITGSKQQGSNVIISTPGGSNTISFTANAVGSFNFNAIVTDTGTTNPFTVNSPTVTITVSAASCQIALSANAVNFGSIIASHTYSTNQIVTDTNNGVTGAFIATSGTNWLGPNGIAPSFGVGNTLWDVTKDSSYIGNALSLIPSNTNIPVSGSGGSNSIYFGLGIPSGQAANVYTQNIIITNVC